MKKIIIIIAAILALVGCEKSNASLVGTKWTYQFNSSTYVMEFTSKTDVRTYEADNNYNFKGSLTEGEYNYSNGKITFGENFCVARGIMIILYYRYYFKTATIEGDVMKVISSEEQIIFPIEDGEVQEPEIKNLGDYTFTLMKLK
jgi:hypothetical protein